MDKPTVVAFPARDVAEVPRMLRDLANRIEAGEYKNVKQVVWVMDQGDKIAVGLVGTSVSIHAEAYYLLAKGQQVLMVGSQ